jgi:hypothetical protein
MTKDEANRWVVFLESRKDGLSSTSNCGGYFIEFVQHDFAVWTDIVDVEFDSVTAWLADTVTCKSWIESHFYLESTCREGAVVALVMLRDRHSMLDDTSRVRNSGTN